MKLNIKKCKVMAFVRISSSIPYQYSDEGCILERVHKIKDLRVTFLSNLSFRDLKCC